MKPLFISLFFITTLACLGQKDSVRAHLIIKTNPFSYVNPSFPTFTLGVEARPWDWVFFQVEYGHPFYRLDSTLSGFSSPQRLDNARFRTFRAEIRTYQHKKKTFESYWAFETFYITQKTTLNHSFANGINGGQPFNQAFIHNQCLTWIGKFGLQVFITKYLALDLYSGFGLRKNYNHVTITDANWQVTAFYNNVLLPGTSVSPYFPFGIKLGVIIF